MLFVLIAWSVLGATFVGLGLSFLRVLRFEASRAEDLFDSFWIGWAIALTCLQMWNIFLPVNHWLSLIVATAGALGLIWNRDILLKACCKASYNKWLVIALLAIIVWLANIAIGPPVNGDSGLYHFSSVRWAQSCAAVPGLGNLHGRLAFNQSYFLYVAMLDVGPFVHRSQHIANGILLFVLLAQILLSWQKLYSAKTEFRPGCLFYALLLPAALKQAIGGDLSSPTPDFAVWVLQIVLSARLFSFLADFKSDCNPKRSLVVMAYISAIGISVKLSFALLGISTIVVAFAVYAYGGLGRRPSLAAIGSTLLLSVLLFGLVLIPWCLLGVITSGYVAYPCSFLAIPVDWQIPRKSVIGMMNCIYSWARQPGVHWSAVLGRNDWMQSWIVRVAALINRLEIAITVVAVLSAIATVSVRSKRDLLQEKVRWFFLVPCCVSLVFWFLTAPDPRFAGSVFWILVTGIIALNVQTFGLARINVAHAMLCIWVLLTVYMAWSNRNHFASASSGPGPDAGFHPVPRAAMKTFVTRSGLTLYVPCKPDWSWDAPLPNTPYPNAYLRQRTPGDLSKGFISDYKESDTGMHK